MYQRLAVLVTGLALVLAVGGAPAQAAPAEPKSATGSVAIATFTYQFNGLTIKIPTGCFFTHTIKGANTRVTYQAAGTDCAGPASFGPGFCNYRIDFIYYDLKGKHYLTHRGLTQLKCEVYTLWKDPAGNWSIPHYGKACATLTVHNKERARQCHAITGA
jgi:hypothetical protein